MDDERWDAMLGELQRYAEVHGDCIVVRQEGSGPGVVCTEKGCNGANHKQLGRWTSKQRHVFKKGMLAEERRERLEAVGGWQWGVQDTKWNTMFAQLQKYQSVHKTCIVTRQEGGGSGHMCAAKKCKGANHQKLGKWTSKQRQLYKKGRLTAERQERLNAVPGWLWVVE